MSGVGVMWGWPATQGGFLRGVGQGDVDDVDRPQVGLAGVEAALEDLQVGDLRCVHAQGLGGQAAQGGLGVGRWRAVGVGLGGGVGGAAGLERDLGQGQFEFGDADHGGGLWRSSRRRAGTGTPGADNTGVERAGPPLAQGPKGCAGGTSGLHRTA